MAVDGNWNARDPCQLKDAVGINSRRVLLVFLSFSFPGAEPLFCGRETNGEKKVCLDGSVTREVFYFYLVFVRLFHHVSSYLSMTCQWIFHHLYINFLHNRRTFSPFSFPFELFRALPLRLASRYYSWAIFPLRLRFPFRGSTPAVQTLDDGRFSLIWRWTWSTWCQETKERDGRFKNRSSFPPHMYSTRTGVLRPTSLTTVLYSLHWYSRAFLILIGR